MKVIKNMKNIIWTYIIVAVHCSVTENEEIRCGTWWSSSRMVFSRCGGAPSSSVDEVLEGDLCATNPALATRCTYFYVSVTQRSSLTQSDTSRVATQSLGVTDAAFVAYADPILVVLNTIWSLLDSLFRALPAQCFLVWASGTQRSSLMQTRYSSLHASTAHLFRTQPSARCLHARRVSPSGRLAPSRRWSRHWTWTTVSVPLKREVNISSLWLLLSENTHYLYDTSRIIAIESGCSL